MKGALFYLIYCDIGDNPTDLDELHLGWTNVLYYANLRAKQLVKVTMGESSSLKQIRIVPFHSLKEMERFLSDFSEYYCNAPVNIMDYYLWLYKTETSLSPVHYGIWSTEEILLALEAVCDIQHDLRIVETATNKLLSCESIIRDKELMSSIRDMCAMVVNYLALYKLRYNFVDDIEEVNQGERSRRDFDLVRKAFLSETGLDIVTQNVTEEYFGVFDMTEMLIRLSGLEAI